MAFPLKTKNELQGFGHSKHKNNYALFTKLNTEKVMFGGLPNSCMGKKAYFLEVVVDSHRTSQLLNVAISYHATSWRVVRVETELSKYRDEMLRDKEKEVNFILMCVKEITVTESYTSFQVISTNILCIIKLMLLKFTYLHKTTYRTELATEEEKWV